jgi:hypothetical protein
MKLFCQQCFAKVEYKFSKPKFCPECGKQMGTVLSKVETVTTSKNPDADRIRELELQLEKFKNDKTGSNKREVLSKRYQDYVDNEDEEEYDDEDYNETQKHIDNFKNKKNKIGVSIEKNNPNRGISFGQLMEGVSSGSISAGDEFKMTDDSPRKTDKQILEELRIEASSKSRTIEID